VSTFEEVRGIFEIENWVVLPDQFDCSGESLIFVALDIKLDHRDTRWVNGRDSAKIRVDAHTSHSHAAKILALRLNLGSVFVVDGVLFQRRRILGRVESHVRGRACHRSIDYLRARPPTPRGVEPRPLRWMWLERYYFEAKLTTHNGLTAESGTDID